MVAELELLISQLKQDDWKEKIALHYTHETLKSVLTRHLRLLKMLELQYSGKPLPDKEIELSNFEIVSYDPKTT